tara:strand:+ start:90 stop:2741 length:2652 start_codon:yes stop_codon:yes gene_type:complete
MENLLKSSKTRESHHTHVSMGAYKSKYNFNRENLEQLYSIYRPTIDKLTLAEKPQHYSPVLVDIDIKRKIESDLSPRLDKNITDTVQIYQKVLKSIVKGITDKELTCLFLDKPAYNFNDTHIKNGFHLHFPYIFLSKEAHQIHLIPRVKVEVDKLETFKNLGFEKSSGLVDDITSNMWLLYGASKHESMEPYTLSKCYNHDLQEITVLDALKGYEIFNKQENIIKLNTEKTIKTNLTRILSIIPYNRNVKELKENLPNICQGAQRIQRINVSSEKEKVDTFKESKEDLLKDASSLINLLNKDRSEDRSSWLEVGWIMFNISDGSEEGFQIWDTFSGKSDKYQEGVCEYQWSKMTHGSKTIGSLKYMVEIDNKKGYNEWKYEKSSKSVNESLNGSHYDIADVFKTMYADENIKITSQKDLSCYIWDDKTKLWVDKGKESLSMCLMAKVSPVYIKKGKKILAKIAECSDKAELSMLNTHLKQVQKMIGNLKSTPYISNVCKAFSGYEIDKDFEAKVINRVPNELPIKNGKVINFKTLEVRERTRTDYWSFECDVEFLGEKSNLEVVEGFFSDVCCKSKDLIDYHRRLWGYMMTGEISDRSLHIFWGNGCNGKSSVINIFKNITKQFTCSLSEDIMLKKSSRGASPEMMDLLSARCGALPESDKKEELNSKKVKTITGDDEINARHLFGHQIKFKTQCKPIWATNHKPKINVEDQAILDRLKLIPFLGRFEKNADNTLYIKDLQENKLNEFFTWFAMGAYDWYNGQELLPCKEMIDEMGKYINENDVVQEFLSETYDMINKEEYGKLKRDDKINYVQNKTHVYGEFLCWIEDNNRKEDNMGKKEFNIQLDSKSEGVKTNKITRGMLAKKKEDDKDFDEDFDNININ